MNHLGTIKKEIKQIMNKYENKVVWINKCQEVDKIITDRIKQKTSDLSEYIKAHFCKKTREKNI